MSEKGGVSHKCYAELSCSSISSISHQLPLACPGICHITMAHMPSLPPSSRGQAGYAKSPSPPPLRPCQCAQARAWACTPRSRQRRHARRHARLKVIAQEEVRCFAWSILHRLCLCKSVFLQQACLRTGMQHEMSALNGLYVLICQLLQEIDLESSVEGGMKKLIDAAGAGASFTSPGWLTQLGRLWGGKSVCLTTWRFAKGQARALAVSAGFASKCIAILNMSESPARVPHSPARAGGPNWAAC